MNSDWVIITLAVALIVCFEVERANPTDRKLRIGAQAVSILLRVAYLVLALHLIVFIPDE